MPFQDRTIGLHSARNLRYPVKVRRSFPFLILLALAPALAFGAADPLTGVRISLLGLQAALAAPPLPSLDSKHRGSITPVAAYLKATLKAEETAAAPDGYNNTTQRTAGNFKGHSLGLGFATAGKNSLGFYGFFVYDKMDGDVKLTVDEDAAATVELQGMKNSGYALAAGVSYRLIRTQKDAFSVGVFAGPTYTKLSSAFTAKLVASNQAAFYSADPASFGAHAGLQAGLRLLDLYVNPYAILYGDFSDGCKSYSPASSNIGGGTGGRCGAGKLHLNMATGVFGVNVGVWGLFLTAYSHFDKDPALGGAELTQYVVSYTFLFGGS